MRVRQVVSTESCQSLRNPSRSSLSKRFSKNHAKQTGFSDDYTEQEDKGGFFDKNYEFGRLRQSLVERVTPSMNELRGRSSIEFVGLTRSRSFENKANCERGQTGVNGDYAEEDVDGGILENYKFGQIRKSIIQRAISPMDKLRGRSTNELESISRSLDEEAKCEEGQTGVSGDTSKQDVEGGLLKNYEFGQMSKSLVERASSPINKLTSDGSYKFGVLSRFLDIQAKSKIKEISNLSRSIDSRIKDKVNEYTGKDEYKVGDISRTIVRKVASGKYTFADITLLCKILIKMGADFSPVASFLPLRLLLELFDYSIAMELGERFVKTISVELDKRMNESATEDQGYTAGDLTKQAILDYTGKDNYSFGDLSRKILEQNPGVTKDDGADRVGSSTKKIGYSLASPWKADEGTESEINCDVLKELEECLAMEKALIEKLKGVGAHR